MPEQKPINFLWKPALSPSTLSNNDVHIWCAPLDQPPERIQQLAQTLTPDEAERAERFVFDHHRLHFIAGRGILRAILGHYLKVSPASLRFKYGPQGKPELETNTENPLCFNLSHSGGVVIYAVARNRELGIDIEGPRQLDDMDQIAKRFFSPTEYNALRAVPAKQRHTAFFNCWTRKEAYIKAIGSGLSQPLDEFVVSLAPGEPARLLSVQTDPQAIHRWSLTNLKPATDYIAALVVEGKDWQLTCRQWPNRPLRN